MPDFKKWFSDLPDRLAKFGELFAKWAPTGVVLTIVFATWYWYITDANFPDGFNDLAGKIAWPVVIALFLLTQREPIGLLIKRLSRLRKIRGPGWEGEFGGDDTPEVKALLAEYNLNHQ